MDKIINASVTRYATSTLPTEKAMVTDAVHCFTTLTSMRNPTKSAQTQTGSETESCVMQHSALYDGST